MSERKCAHCGAAVPDSDFITLCPACGRPLEKPEAAPAPPPKPEPPAEDVVCASCGAPNDPKSERCWQCRRLLSGGAPEPVPVRAADRESLDLGRVFADALGARRPDEDLDEALLRAAKAASSDHWDDLFTVALHMLHQAVVSGEQREAAAARLAAEHVEVAISSSRQVSRIEMGEGPSGSARVLSSLDELPPELRERIEQRLGPLSGRVSGSKITVTSRVVVGGDEVPRAIKGVSRKVTIRSQQGTPPRAKGCVSISTLAALVLGALGLRR